MSSQASWGDTPPIDSSDALEPPSNYTEQPSVGAISAHEDMDDKDDQPLLAHMTKKKKLPAGNLKQLLSADHNKAPSQAAKTPPHEVNLNGTIYRQVNATSITYTISAGS